MKAIIFDLGNVLVAYDHGQTMDAVAAVSALTGAELRAVLTPELGHAVETGEMDGHELHEYLVQRAGVTRDFDRFYAAFCSAMTPDQCALDYALALQARSDITVAVLSNTNQLHVRWLDAHVPELEEIDLVMMSNEVHLAKPDPAIFQLALELIGLPAERTCLVDDTAPNVEAASALGMQAILHVQWVETRPALEAWLESA